MERPGMANVGVVRAICRFTNGAGAKLRCSACRTQPWTMEQVNAVEASKIWPEKCLLDLLVSTDGLMDDAMHTINGLLYTPGLVIRFVA